MNHIFAKGLVSRIHFKSSKFNNKKTTQQKKGPGLADDTTQEPPTHRMVRPTVFFNIPNPWATTPSSCLQTKFQGQQKSFLV